MDSPSSTPWQAADRPLYNIQAVVAATGVPAPTLRSWERRYGLPAPVHNERGYRLYSDRDIAVTRWLQTRRDEGMAISRAVDMLRAMNARPAAPEAVAPRDGAAERTERAGAADLVDRVLRATRDMDEQGVARAITDALQTLPVEDVLLHVLQPALYRVGELWAAGELSITAERFGSNLVRGHLAQLMQVAPPRLRAERVLVGCAPGEQHDLGPLMLALFLRRSGFDVVYLGANVEAGSLAGDVRRLSPAALCLGASTALTVPALADLFRCLSNDYSGVLAFGGQAFIQHPECIDTMPGLYLGPDAATAAAGLRAALAHVDKK
ncbi:MAG: cobalamin-dependent protein [Chloroflexota bacterium]